MPTPDSASHLTQVLAAASAGDRQAAENLLPLVYDELRRIAALQLAHEKAGQTLEATALVHEAYLRVVTPGGERAWDNRRHFFAAAAEAMRRILVEMPAANSDYGMAANDNGSI